MNFGRIVQISEMEDTKFAIDIVEFLKLQDSMVPESFRLQSDSKCLQIIFSDKVKALQSVQVLLEEFGCFIKDFICILGVDECDKVFA